ncbi:SPON1 (predicted), partial [Pycnogonum litorale]
KKRNIIVLESSFRFTMKSFVRFVVLIFLLRTAASTKDGEKTVCDRQPSGKHSPKTPGDNGFKIVVSGNPTHYIPGQTYTVSIHGLKTHYNQQKFTGFNLVVEAKGRENTVEKRDVGQFQLFGDSLTRLAEKCPTMVVQTSALPKPEIQVKWTSPPAASGCVLFKATIIEYPENWYMDDGGLTKQLCEIERPENEVQQPTVIQDCCACDEAKYEVTFEGLWSRHTHPKDFPSNLHTVHFSDIIGASHSADFRMWEYGGKATPGVKDLAQYGITKNLESELKLESDRIRTIIKARGLWYPSVNGKTFAVFRVDKSHHLMSLLSMIGPSPDWVVGVSALELCTVNCSWIESQSLDLYPWDAGTDGGITYMSADKPTLPQEPIRRITPSFPDNEASPFYDRITKTMKPLARLTISRKRVYSKPCDGKQTKWQTEVSGEPDPAKPECAVSEWSAFTPCPVTCGPGIVMRSRSFRNQMKAKMFDCQAQLVEKKMCDTVSCDSVQLTKCRTSLWSEWSECGVTCGKGFRTRRRRYLLRKARKVCNERLTEKEYCVGSELYCPKTNKMMDPDCEVTQWSEWSPCTVSCGKGLRIRTRLRLKLNQHKQCQNELMQKSPCMADRIDCAIGPTEAREVCIMKKKVGPCRGYFPRWYYDVTKGLCLQFIYGGCRGNRNNFEHYVDCKQICEMIRGSLASSSSPPTSPRKTFIPLVGIGRGTSFVNRGDIGVVDCMVTEWLEWSECSRTCGKGRRERRRFVKAMPKNGGQACPTKLVQKRKCRGNKPCPVDCVLGEWTTWSECSKTCGEALKKRT